MKLDQLDKNKTSIAALSAVIALILETVLDILFSMIYRVFMHLGLLSMIINAVMQVVFTMIVFVGGYNITTNLIFKNGRVKTKDMYEMGLTVGLACIAFQRLLNMFGIYTSLMMIVILGIMFAGAYHLVPDSPMTEEEGGPAYGQQTVYRKEKVIQKGSGADNLMMYVFIFLWGCGIIFTWGGFIVQPRSQAPAFYGIGMVCLLLAFLWTYKKIDDHKIETYKKIILPSTWPSDCSYEKYHQGLHVRVAKQSGGLLGDKNMKFYNECRSNHVFDLTSEYNMQKAMKVAEKQKIKDYNEDLLREMFEKGKELVEHDQQAASVASSSNMMNQKRIEELNKMAEGLKFYGLHGMSKREEMLRALMREADKKRKDAEMMSSMASRTMLQKEHDWATHGGIASGIAGPAAGIATALDIQAKNAVIREQNAKMMPYVAMVSSSYSNTAAGYRAEHDKYAADLRACHTKLIASDSKEDVMKQIVIKDAKYTVSTTGAVTVTANFSVNPEYRIFESTKPTIDGCVACRLMQDGKCMGSAYFVFPVEGIITPVTLSALCTKTVDPNASYTLVFEPDDVWAMEKL